MQDNNHLLLSKFITKLFSFASHKSGLEDSDSKDLISTRMLNLSVFFQHTMNALSSQDEDCTKPVLQIASACLNILKIMLETNANGMDFVRLHSNLFLLHCAYSNICSTDLKVQPEQMFSGIQGCVEYILKII